MSGTARIMKKSQAEGHVRSLSALAELAARQTQSAGFALYERRGEGTDFQLLTSWGTYRSAVLDIRRTSPISADAAGERSIWLSTNGSIVGVLIVHLNNQTPAPGAEAIWERTARNIEKLMMLREQASQLSLTKRIGELEATLVDEKVADKVAGILESRHIDSSALEGVERHIDSVLNARSLDRVLAELLNDLEQRTAERGLLARAKLLLQNQKGLSEQQAHIQLRIASRRNRRRVGEVARDVIQELEAQAK